MAGALTENQKKWLNDDYICRLTILQAMNDSLFNTFQKYATALEL
ncbi:hypothetical protein COLO4_12042 [Corchorus olitorius]|uniref:Uncharacterized protein n=1 Tax=Corchorus olitorius TaxID=93759 RepID=A0A1R3K2D4_9ROSI|nr:hypothetical protein COLO4_12042 [Corchorus olitorius]